MWHSHLNDLDGQGDWLNKMRKDLHERLSAGSFGKELPCLFVERRMREKLCDQQVVVLPL